jgi:hypothetical protein
MNAAQFVGVVGILALVVLVIGGGLILIGWHASHGRAFSIDAYETGIRVIKDKVQGWLRPRR